MDAGAVCLVRERVLQLDLEGAVGARDELAEVLDERVEATLVPGDRVASGNVRDGVWREQTACRDDDEDDETFTVERSAQTVHNSDLDGRPPDYGTRDIA